MLWLQSKERFSDLETVDIRSPLLGSHSRADEPLFVPKRQHSRLLVHALSVCLAACCLSALVFLRRKGRPFPLTACQPFERLGRLHVNASHALDTAWVPFDDSCPASNFLPRLASAETHFPWLQDKTVALIGDSIDRWHLDHFCYLTKGEFAVIDSSHPLSPAPVTHLRPFEEEGPHAEDNRTIELTRPHLCHIPSHNFTMISMFQYGMPTPEEFALESKGDGRDALYKSPHYFAPAMLEDRVQSQLVPVLDKLGRQPDVIEFGSSFWDLMHLFHVERVNQNYDEDYSTWTEMSDAQLHQWSIRLEQVLLNITTTFPSAQKILWRVPNVPRRQQVIPPSRIEALRAKADWTIQRLTHSSFAMPSLLTKAWSDVFALATLGPKQRLAFVLGQNPWGRLIDGQLQYYDDRLHPGLALNALWGEIILHEMSKLN